MALKALKPREAAIFAVLADTYCGPEPALPPIAHTTAVAFIDDLVSRSSLLNRIGFRLILRMVDLAPYVRGHRARFTRLAAGPRTDFVNGLDRSRWTILRVLSRLLKTVTVTSYYGDETLLRMAGFDPDAIVRRGRTLRSQEGRP